MIRLGWTLLHFLWQGTVIAAVLAAVRAIVGRSIGAQARYAMACVALGAMTVAPVLTYLALAPMATDYIAPLDWTIPAIIHSNVWQRALPWLVIAWAAGVIVFSIRLIGGWRLASRLRRVSVRPAPAEWEQEFQRLLRHMGEARPVRLLVSALVETPMVISWMRPVVLMPVGALTGLPAEHVIALLAHEIGHILRNDYLANMLQSVAEVALFYHPAVWWVSEQIRNERELCCDDLAVAASGGDVLTYARALAEIEGARPTHARAAMAANGGSLVTRIRRLIGHAPSLSQMLPGPGAAAVLTLIWLVGIGVAAMHGSQTSAPRIAIQALQDHVRPALLYDPLFEPPHAAAQARVQATVEPEPAKPPETVVPPDNQHGHRITFEAAYLVESNEPMVAPAPATLAAMIARLGPDSGLTPKTVLELLGSSNYPANYGGANARIPKFTSSVPAVAVEMWVEDSYSSFIESMNTPVPAVERETGKATIHPFLRDLRRKLIVDFPVTIETLPEPGTYRVSFPGQNSGDEVPAGFTRVSPTFPVPQILHDGDTIRLESYREQPTGPSLVDYIHVGSLNKITPRDEAPHDAYAVDAEFNLSRAQFQLNGVKQDLAAVPETLRGPVAWVYVPGYGRYVLSYKPQTDADAERVGEANGDSLTFSDGHNVFRIACSERIASGSGAYRVYAVKDAAWAPADPNDRKIVMIGVATGR